jgi:2-polyprenyl-3-methyl-5-hydroxy-6-metoxy-1,4-benzoquinol methylase
MKPIQDLYGEKYCLRNSLKKWRFKEVPIIVGVLQDYLKPKSVVDIGCSNGLYLKEFKNLGTVCFGIEGADSFKGYIKENFGTSFLIRDLRKPLQIDNHFHLALCIEVLEHLEEEFADIAVSNICNTADVFCITASPTKTARFHVNAQGKGYWIGKFESVEGICFQERETEELGEIFRDLNLKSDWMANNLMIFRRDN